MKQVYLDSNIIIRLLIKDPPEQLLKAKKIIEAIEENKLQGLISILVINEIIWILEHYYEVERRIFIPWILKLLAIKNLKTVEVAKDSMINIIHQMEGNKFDFTDLYLAETAGRKEIISFDKDFDKLKSQPT